MTRWEYDNSAAACVHFYRQVNELQTQHNVYWHIARRCVISDLEITATIISEIPNMTDTALDAAIEAASRNECPHMYAYLIDEKHKRGFTKSGMRL